MLRADILGDFASQFAPPDQSYLGNPALWGRDILGEHWWSKQVEIGQSLVDHRYTAVPSCFDAGKSFIASRLIRWWLDVHPIGEAFVVWTAPTYYQVDAIIGRELRGVGDTIHPVHIDMSNRAKIGDRLVGYGRKPADHNKEAFQGIHDRYVLVVIDESNGVPASLFDAVDGLSTNENARVLAIGNPDAPGTQFERICKPGSGWNVIPIDGYDTPNFTDEDIPERLREMLLSPVWVEERRQRWGEESPLFQSKVRGRFPDVGDDTLFTPSMIHAAHALNLPGTDSGRYFFDIARMGEDETVGYRNRGGVIRLAYSARKQDTMATVSAISRILVSHDDHVPAWIDVVGLGAGVYDRLRELGRPVSAFNAGERARNPRRFVNRRAEVYYEFREAMQDVLVDLDPDDEELSAQLGAIKYGTKSDGRIYIESKDDMRKRRVASPDRADAVVGCWARMTDEGLLAAGEGTMPSITGDLLTRAL